MMPLLSAEFGLLPWHLGGDPWLTDREAEAYLEAGRAIADERRRAARASRRT